MPFTMPPTPPNSGDPGPFNDRMDAMLGWFPTHVAELNAELPRLAPRYLAARSGSANAIVLTAGFETLFVGAQVRFRAASPNTGAATINLDGTGAIACRTISGAVLPAGFIRTDSDTIATYDGTNWVLDRQIERGSNANGRFTRWSDGTQVCEQFMAAYAAPEISVSTIAVSPDGPLWTFPASFAASPNVSSSVNSGVARWSNARALSTSGARAVVLAANVSTTPADLFFLAVGRWY